MSVWVVYAHNVHSLPHGITISYTQPQCTREIPSAGGARWFQALLEFMSLLCPAVVSMATARCCTATHKSSHLYPRCTVPWGGCRVRRHLLTFLPAAAENNLPDSTERLFLKHQAALHTFAHWTHTREPSITLTSPSALGALFSFSLRDSAGPLSLAHHWRRVIFYDSNIVKYSLLHGRPEASEKSSQFYLPHLAEFAIKSTLHDVTMSIDGSCSRWPSAWDHLITIPFQTCERCNSIGFYGKSCVVFVCTL